VLVVVTGISHKTASLELREKLALDGEAALRVGRDLLAHARACEAVALSTCNRTEVYTYASDVAAANGATVACLAHEAGVPVAELEPVVYHHAGDGAIAHLFRVAASLDAMVVGEYQIVAQLKDAYQAALEGGCTGPVLNRLFRRALEVGKRVRTETAIGARPVSVSSAAVELAAQVFGRLKKRVVLIVGAGETSELTATHLKAHGGERILVTNRTYVAAEELARRVGGRAVPFEDLEGHLAAADIVISSTAAPHYVITREHVERAMKHRRHRPLCFIDIAVPRDLDPAIGRIDDAFLYDIDDLRHIVEENRHEREKEVAKAECIVEEELDEMRRWLRSLEVVPTIAGLRDKVEGIRRRELDRLAGRLGDLSERQREQVEILTMSIVNKILHTPTVRMKEAAERDECYLYVDAVRMLFELDGSEAAEAEDEADATEDEAAGAEDEAAGAESEADGAGAPEEDAPCASAPAPDQDAPGASTRAPWQDAARGSGPAHARDEFEPGAA